MRDYWLTKELLQAAGIGFVLLALIGIGLALWLPKKWWGKLLAVLAVGFVIAIPIYKVIQDNHQQQVVVDDYKERLAKAQALFDERCKTAGEKIYKTVDKVEGMLLVKVRPSKINLSDQYAMDDPYGRDFGGDEYLASFLQGRNSDGTFTQRHKLNTYKFVEVEDEVKKIINRYEAVQMSSQAGVPYLKLKVSQVTTRSARYGVDWADLSTKEDRDHWIAGSSLKIIDLTANQVIAERIGFMFDRGLGDQSGGRSPWAYAEYQACPAFEKFSGGYPSKTSRSRDFILRVLQPIKGA